MFVCYRNEMSLTCIAHDQYRAKSIRQYHLHYLQSNVGLTSSYQGKINFIANYFNRRQQCHTKPGGP